MSKSKRKNYPTSLMAQNTVQQRKRFHGWLAIYNLHLARPARIKELITEELESYKKTQPCKTQGRTIINLSFKHFHQQISCIHFKQHINSISRHLYTTLSLFIDSFASSHVVSFSPMCKLALAHTLCISGLYER